jgi:hypothetical protein
MPWALTKQRRVIMAENVIIKYGKFEVDGNRMRDCVQQQEINEAERDRIIKSRHNYLHWMHVHFADNIACPPENEE